MSIILGRATVAATQPTCVFCFFCFGNLFFVLFSDWSNWDINNTMVGDISEGVNTAYVHADVHSIVCSPHDASGNTFFICTDGGLFRTTNGGTIFETLNGGLNTSQIYANAAISAGRAECAPERKRVRRAAGLCGAPCRCLAFASRAPGIQPAGLLHCH